VLSRLVAESPPVLLLELVAEVPEVVLVFVAAGRALPACNGAVIIGLNP
jgi:hypothetical protein